MTYINPWRLFHGAYVPEWLMRQKGVSPGAKLTYARLCRFAGKKGEAFPTQIELAEEVGVEQRQVRNYLKELRDLELIEVVQQGLNRPNLYRFHEHPWMGLPDRQDVATPERRDLAAGERSDSAAPTSSRESQDESHLAPVGPAPVAKARPRDLVWEALMEVCGVDTGSIPPSKRGAYNRACQDLRAVDASPDEVIRRAEVYRNRFPGTMTPNALVSHWAECDPAVAPMRQVSRGQDAITRVLGS